MKKLFKKISIVLLLGFFTVYVIGFFKEYRILNWNPILKHHIDNDLSRSVDDHIENTVRIKEKIKLKNELVVYYTFETAVSKQHGYRHYKQGFNLLYETSGLSYTTQNGYETYPYLDAIIDTSNKKYIIIMGRNENNYQMIEFQVSGSDVQYKLNLPNKEYFIIYTEVPITTEPHSSAINIKLYNNDN